MKCINYITLLFVSLLLLSCKKEGCTNELATNYDSKAKEEDCSCTFLVDEMEGTFNVIVTKYPRQVLQEGEEKEILVFNDHKGCNSESDEEFDRIRFNNLFTFFGCDEFTLNGNSFEVTLEHKMDWAGAPVEGVGSITDGVFHFEGTVYTSAGEFPIILDGNKTIYSRRTSAF